MSGTRPGEALSDDSYRTPRTIVLCFDGTKGQYDSTNTNVVKFFGLLRKDCPERQVAYYQAGIGTYFAPGVVSPLWAWLASLLDEASAWYLDAHVMEGYKYIMDNYRSGDKVCLFGFSRGAYTARALAGMLTKVGLLASDNTQQVGFAYKAYKRSDKEGVKLAAGFKKTFSQDVKIEFVGVWDTVQSTGVLVNRVLPFTDSNCAIRVFRHALSLDEHRSRFRPNLYHRSRQQSEPDETPAIRKPRAANPSRRLSKRKRQQHRAVDSGLRSDGAQPSVRGDAVTPDQTEPETKLIAEESLPRTDVLEVWFSGCHGDIGGGSVQDDVKVSLAQITLHWMVEQVIQSQCGILFDDDKLAHIGFKSPPLPPQQPVTRGLDFDINEPVQPTPSPRHPDAIAPLFDRLKTNKLWWILEILPSSNAWQDASGAWHQKWSVNLGRGRKIPFEKPKFHHTVKERMDHEPLEYKPRAIYNHHEVYV